MNITPISPNYQQRKNVNANPSFKAKVTFDTEAWDVLTGVFKQEFPLKNNNDLKTFMKQVKKIFEALTDSIEGVVFQIGAEAGELKRPSISFEDPTLTLKGIKIGNETHQLQMFNSFTDFIKTEDYGVIDGAASKTAKGLVCSIADVVKDLAEPESPELIRLSKQLRPIAIKNTSLDELFEEDVTRYWGRRFEELIDEDLRIHPDKKFHERLQDVASQVSDELDE